MIKQFDVWIADLSPRMGTETGKIRPVVIVQTNLLNKEHGSTIVCPITTNVQPESEILRVHLKQSTAKLTKDCDIMIDQIRAIDNRRLLKKTGEVGDALKEKIKENLRIILDLE